MTAAQKIKTQKKHNNGFSIKQVVLIIMASMFVAIFATVFAIKIFLFPTPFKPVILSLKEEQQLSTKIAKFDMPENTNDTPIDNVQRKTLKPEKYSERDGSREIHFTERELNAMLAKNTDLASTLAIDLAKDMISIKLLVPLDQDFPMLGGKTLRVKAGAELAYRDDRPVVKLRGISLMGVPMPNSWLGGLKNIDLIDEFGYDEGFWKSFADGVDSITVGEGFLNITLKE